MTSRSVKQFYAAVVLLAVVSPTAPVSAQLTAVIDGGGSRITYAGAGGLSVGSVSPTLEWLTPSTSISAGGSFAQFAGGGWSLQGAATGSVFTPSLASFRGEFAVTAIGSTHQDGGTAGDMLGRGRLHWLGANAGVWVGAAVGRAWNGVQWRLDQRGDVGAWLRRDALTVTATAAPTWLGDSLRFLDADLTAHTTYGPLEVTAFGGVRHWSRPADVAGSSWTGASAALWLGAHIALIAAGGSYPADYAQGLPGGTYASLGFRLASRRPGRDLSNSINDRRPAATTTSVVGADARPRAPMAPSLEVSAHDSSDGDQRTFSLRAPAAHRVELMGDFTQWRPIALVEGQDGTWSVTLPVKPGLYRMNVRVDGGAWSVPAGLLAVADDFGGRVGVLEIEAP